MILNTQQIEKITKEMNYNHDFKDIIMSYFNQSNYADLEAFLRFKGYTIKNIINLLNHHTRNELKEYRKYKYITINEIDPNLERYGLIKYKGHYYKILIDTHLQMDAIKLYDQLEEYNQNVSIISTFKEEKLLYYVVIRKEDKR